jgi:hypothetical protein
LINFSSKITITRRIENKPSPLISIDESDAELFAVKEVIDITNRKII